MQITPSMRAQGAASEAVNDIGFETANPDFGRRIALI
jgi:hypothetical protein